MSEISVFLCVIASYLCGSIPFGWLAAKAVQGTDIRKQGSGNPGSANVYRTVGKTAGWATLAADVAKGWLPVWAAMQAYPGNRRFAALCGFAAIAGHLWMPWFGFKGGKGVATSAGVFTLLSPLATLGAAIAFTLATAASKHISIGSMAAAAALTPLLLLCREPFWLTGCAAALCALVLYRHIPNLKRLMVNGGNDPRRQAEAR